MDGNIAQASLRGMRKIASFGIASIAAGATLLLPMFESI
jgi:hypothetical protein